MVKLTSFTCSQDRSGNSFVEGRVKNISGMVIEKRINVHATFYDAKGHSLGSNDGYLDYVPLLVDQEAPFKIYGVENPAYSSCSIDAMTVGFGTQIAWEK